MALVRDRAAPLLDKADQLHELLKAQARIQFQSGTGAGEVRSWQNSLPPLLKDLDDAGLGHVEVLLEHKLPFSPKRADVVICGVHPKTRRPSYVVVELKQWTTATMRPDGMVTVPQYGQQPVLHPIDQVRSYCQYLVDYVPSLAHGDLHGIAYLHHPGASSWALNGPAPDAYGRQLPRHRDCRVWAPWSGSGSIRLPERPGQTALVPPCSGTGLLRIRPVLRVRISMITGRRSAQLLFA